MHNKIAVVGAGFSGLSAAAYLAKDGFEVHVFEKHNQPGGRARQFKTTEGFVFDMGPSWYWMPDIIEHFFNDFGYSTNDFYELKALNPQFEMIFEDMTIAVPEKYDELRELLDGIEAGAGRQLDRFMDSAKYKYEVGMKEFVYKPSYSWAEFVSAKIVSSALKLDLLTNFRKYVSKYFSDEKIKSLMEFPVIFLGASPNNIPAMYSLMNYGGYVLGTHYPQGGFYQLVLAMKEIAEQQGVIFHFEHNIEQILVSENSKASLLVNGVNLEFDYIVCSSDYHHSEQLLPSKFRNYDDAYWKNRVFAPSSLIYYLGFKENINGLKHHSLFFENPLDSHINDIYEDKKWPDKPLFYACCPSKTDPSVAPAYGENLFLLMPMAIGLSDNEEIREQYLKQMLERLERYTGVSNLYDKLEYKRSYCVSDFERDYNAYGGNAYGLANTLGQTAVLKPKIKNKKVNNLFYTGQLTVPGPGVPPSIISGKIVANEVSKLKKRYNEKIV